MINWAFSSMIVINSNLLKKFLLLPYVNHRTVSKCTRMSFQTTSSERNEQMLSIAEVPEEPEVTSPENEPAQMSENEIMRRGKAPMLAPAYTPGVHHMPSSSRSAGRAVTLRVPNPFSNALVGKRARDDAVSFHRVMSRKYTNGIVISSGDIHQSADYGVDMLEEGDKAELAKMCRRKVCIYSGRFIVCVTPRVYLSLV